MSPSVQHPRFSRATLPVMPWKNGGGETREIASWPPGAGLDSFGWRISIATIAATGPFSVFAGIDRQIMLLEGDGVQLAGKGGALHHRLDTPHVPFAFSGDEAVDCTLLGGASSDFNVMTRRGHWRADMQVLASSTVLRPSPHGLLLALRGHWLIGAETALVEGDGLFWTEGLPPGMAQPQTPGALLAWVSLHPLENL